MIGCAGMPELPQSDIIDLILCLFQELNDFYRDIHVIQLHNSPMRKKRRQKKKKIVLLSCKRLDKDTKLKVMTTSEPDATGNEIPGYLCCRG